MPNARQVTHARQEVPTLSSAPPLPTASTNTAVHPTTMIQAAVLYCFRDAIIRIRIFTVSGGADWYLQPPRSGRERRGWATTKADYNDYKNAKRDSDVPQAVWRRSLNVTSMDGQQYASITSNRGQWRQFVDILPRLRHPTPCYFDWSDTDEGIECTARKLTTDQIHVFT